MKAKEYVSQAFYLDKRIKAKERQIDWLKSHALYVSPQISDLPKASPAHRSAIEEAVVRIVEIETEVNNGIAQLMKLKKEIGESIHSAGGVAERPGRRSETVGMQFQTAKMR